MKKAILLFMALIVMSCSTEPISEEIITADLKGLVDGTSGVQCNNFQYPPDDIFFNWYPTQEKTSILDLRIWQLKNRVYFRFYPKNGNFQEFLSVINLSDGYIYGYDSNGDYIRYDSSNDIFRIRIVGINGTDYDETFCFNPTSYVSAIYIKGKKGLPDGQFEVEFLDYTSLGVDKFYFSKPSF